MMMMKRDGLQSAIEQTKKEREQMVPQKRKWMRRGEIEAEREKKYLEEMNEKQRQSKRQKLSNDDDDNNNPNKHADDDDEMIVVDDLMELPREQVIQLLRQYNQPITLFGENDIDRLRRLRAFEMANGEFTNRKLAQQNDFAQHLKKHTEQLLEEKQSNNNNNTTNSTTTTDSSNVTDSSSDSTQTTTSTTNTTTTDSTTDGITLTTTQTKRVELQKEIKSGQTEYEYIRSFLRRLLRLWGEYLDERSQEEKKSVQGKIDATIYQQTKGYIRPLLKLLKRQTLPDDITTPLKNICMNLARGDFVKAQDVYYLLSIGNAPWPMGVTAVGIHQRSARSRIESGQIAHILNDEQQRKYIQSVKRLMTFCENILVLQ